MHKNSLIPLFIFTAWTLSSFGQNTSTTTSSIPSILTIQGTEISSITAKLGGNISLDGGASITNRGVVWSTSENPTISKSIDGSGTGSFISSLTGLSANTTYSVRAYATNSAGTGYGNEVTFTTTNSNNLTGIPCSGIPTVTDIDGNTYNTVQIGTQCWTKENLKVTKYRNGTPIPTRLDSAGTIHNNDPANEAIYGKLYNWYAVVNYRGLCPTGWHVPTDAEWTTLTTYLGGEGVAGGKMKSTSITYWSSPNTGATNESGFSALPSGYYKSDVGLSPSNRGSAFFWSATESGFGGDAWSRKLNDYDGYVNRSLYNWHNGFSVRCLRDTNSIVSIPKLTTTAITAITVTSATSGGSITADGSAPITARGVVWSTSTNPTITLTTKTSDGSGTGSFSSSLTGLSPNTTYYVRAYATNSAGTGYGNEISITTNSLCTGCVLSKTGKIWMDRNLGASRVATSSIDAESFGALYQWGRGTDGHQNLPFYDAIALTRTLSGTDSPGHSKFILNSTPPDDWRSPQNDNLWQGASGKNNPCPSGFRLPTYSEFDAERAIFSTQDAAGAYASVLKLPVAGYRSRVIGDNNGKFTVGGYWTSTVSGVSVFILAINSSSAFLGIDSRSNGMSVRCIKDSISTTTASIPTISTIQGTEITSISAKSGGNITADGGASITNRGVVWSTSTNPTITLTTKTSDGTGSGTFVSNLTNLSPNTTYYIRSYATNSAGTGYGNEITFRTILPVVLPTLSTVSASSITTTTATTGGNITSDGWAPITARGVVWSTSTNPTITLTTKTSDGTGTGSFSSALSSLLPSTTYYVRAYATNSAGTSYGNEITFTTSTPVVLPTLSTLSASSITTTTATTGGNITSDGWAPITARGVVWSTSTNPTITLTTKTSDGTGFGTYVSNLSNLSPNTTYYIRAYATNSAGTGYGNEITFRTILPVVLPTISTLSASSITTSTATTGGNVSSDGGATVTSRGVIWSTSENPTISKSIDGSGTGSFISSLTGLSANTTYSVRAYATNSAGTGYGNEVTFTTTNSNNLTGIPCSGIPTVTDIDGNTYNTVQIGTQCWTKENLKVTKYRNGTPIPTRLDSAGTIHNNDPANEAIYGKLYNWYAVVNYRGLCPTGWHVPTDAEWTTLTTYLGGEGVAGGKMKSTSITYWSSPNTGATNESGFSALPSGYYKSDVGLSPSNRGSAFFWSATESGFGGDAWSRKLNDYDGYVNRSLYNWHNGFSVRCLRDTNSIVSIPKLTTTAITAITVTSATSGGSITADGSAPITARGVVWSTSTNPTITLTTKTSDGSGTGSFSSSLTGLSPNTTYYVRAYATNSAGTGYGNEISITTNSLCTGCVLSKTGKIWMDRNLGASRVATSSIDAESFGALYQWGRGTDGHQNLPFYDAIALTRTLSGTDSPGHSKFILNSTPPDDWRSPQNDNLWQGASGKNNPCPSGFRLPTYSEFDAERAIFSTQDAAGAYASVLKLPVAGYRSRVIGDNNGKFTVGGYWTSTVSGVSVFILAVNSSSAFLGIDSRSNGMSVRCIKDSISTTTASIPTISTIQGTEITSISAKSGGNITADGGASITNRGVVWSTSTNPTITLTTKTSDGTGSGTFVSNLTNLSPNTTYYIRAYATNSAGTGYGNEITFRTILPVVLPTISTLSASSITTSTATTGGNVSSDGGAAVNTRGVVWSTSTNPTISLTTKTSDGSGTGSFSSALSSLLPSTTYYVRAYATNSAGTSYGNEITFTTSPKNPNTVVFYTPNINVTCDTLVEMPLLVNNFIGILGAQGSINWDPTKLKYEEISSFGPGSLNLTLSDFGITEVQKGKLSFVWFASNSSAITLADSTSFFIIKFKLINSKETSASVKISNDPLDIELLNSNYEKINYEIGNYFSNQSCFKVSGKIQNPKGLNIPGVTISLSNSGGTKTASTDENGDFSFTNLSRANYSLIPSKLAESNPRSGISIFDLALIQAHIIGKKPLETAYQIIAADVNGSNTISTADMIMLKKFILGIESNFNGKLYSFVDKKHVFSNPMNPFPFPQSIIINSTQNLVIGDFIGVKLGDINFDNIPRNFVPKANSNRKIEFLYEIVLSDLLNKSNEFIYRIKSAKEQDLLGMQFTLNWDSKLANLVAIENNPLGIDFANVSVSNGLLGLSWTSTNGLSKILNENEVVLEIRLKLKSKFNKPALNMNDELLEKEAFDDNFNFKELSLKLENNLDANDLSQYKLFVFPNPAQNNFTLTFNSNKAEKGFVQVTDMLGRLIINQEIEINKGLNNRLFNIPDHIVPGIYNIQLRTSKNFENLKILLKNQN